MSLLSDTQGRPHTVRALLKSVKALGGFIRKAELDDWFVPGEFSQMGKKSSTRVKQTVGCAVSLGWLEPENDGFRVVDIEMATDPDGFGDHLHRTLCGSDKVEDHRIIEAYAFLVLQMEKEKNSVWLRTLGAKELGDQIHRALSGGEETPQRLFNDTKLPPWRAWLEAMGLGWNSKTVGHFLVEPTTRLRRELPGIADIVGRGQEVSPTAVVKEIADCMPYLDGGAVLKSMSDRMNQPMADHVASIVLARSLRELASEGLLVLHQRGDAHGEALRLPPTAPDAPALVVGITLYPEAVS